MTSTVEQVKDKLSITDVVSGYVKLERAGSSLKGRCPFHNERTPSFFVSPDRGTYHCFGCGVHGDIFTFVEEIEGIDFKGALKILADKAGVPIVFEKGGQKDERDRLYSALETATLFFVRALGDNNVAKLYLKERGLTDETVKEFRIGWAPDKWSPLTDYLREKKFTDKEIEAAGLAKKGDRGLYDRFRSRIMFPMMDSAGRVVAFSGRYFEDENTKRARAENTESSDRYEPAKYINSPETVLFRKSKILYGYDRAKQDIRKLNFSILVEGQMDLILSHQSGWGNTVAASGTALTPDHVVLLKRQSQNILVALDADQAGITAATKSAKTALSLGMEVKVARMPSGVDPADLITKEGVDAWKKAIRESKHIITFLLDVLEKSSKGNRGYQKNVEQQVLPFVHVVENPIDKETFIHEIAERLGVSEGAIAEAVRKTPKEETFSQKPSHTVQENKKVRLNLRALQLWKIILWQRALPEPTVDSEEIEKKLVELVGKEEYESLSSLGDTENEKLRFEAESLYEDAVSIEREVKEILRGLVLEKLSKEHKNATIRLKRAEAEGNDEEKERAMEECQSIFAQMRKLQEQ